MAQRCAGTWWEIFDEKRPGIPNVSLCHGWASAPLNLLAGSVAGIRPLTPGYRDTLLKPDLFTLHEIHVRVPVPGGYVSCDIRREGEKFWLTGSSPKDTTLHILLPALEGGNYDVRYGKSKSERQRKIGSYAYIRLKDREQVDFEITLGTAKQYLMQITALKIHITKEDFMKRRMIQWMAPVLAVMMAMTGCGTQKKRSSPTRRRKPDRPALRKALASAAQGEKTKLAL